MALVAQSIKFYGASWCRDCAAVKKFLGEHKVNYEWIDVDRVSEADEELKKLTGGTQTIPTLVLADNSVLVNPEIANLAKSLGIADEATQKYCELAIVGAGPTALGAAIYTTREDIETVLFEKKAIGGLASITDVIDNYPGFPDGVSGLDLSAAMEKQAIRFGATFKLGAEVRGIELEGRYKKLVTSDGDYYAKSVLIAVGTDYKRLGIPGEHELTSRGVHYCATCDGPLYKGKELLVIGGGNSAMQESIFLSKFASKITMLVRGSDLKGTEVLINKITSMPGIEIVFNTVSESIEKTAEGRMLVKAAKEGEATEYLADGIFVFIGLIPNTEWLKGIIDLDQNGFILTDKTFATKLPGVFAAGDARSGSTLQIASAVGEGVTAALMIREYLREEG